MYPVLSCISHGNVSAKKYQKIKLNKASLSKDEDIEGSPRKTKPPVLCILSQSSHRGHEMTPKVDHSLRQMPNVSQETARIMEPQKDRTKRDAAMGSTVEQFYCTCFFLHRMRSKLGPQSAGASDRISPCRVESWCEVNATTVLQGRRATLKVANGPFNPQLAKYAVQEMPSLRCEQWILQPLATLLRRFDWIPGRCKWRVW